MRQSHCRSWLIIRGAELVPSSHWPNRSSGTRCMRNRLLLILWKQYSFGFFHDSFHTVFLCYFWHTTKNFKVVHLCEYLELRGLPHHSSDVFLHEDSISECFRTICELPGLTWIAQCHQTVTRISEQLQQNQWNPTKINKKPMEFDKIQWKVTNFPKILAHLMNLWWL